METKILAGNIDYKLAADMINAGGLVAFPTETVYGLGANGKDERAVNRIFEVKGRPNDNPLILHVSNLKVLENLTRQKSLQMLEKVVNHFMPGPITVVLQKEKSIPDIVTAGLDTVAIRIPSNAVAQEFLKACGVPIAAPSANLSGRPSPTRAWHVVEDLGGKIEGIIDGGACEIGLESTILDLSGDVPAILRQGGVTFEELQEVLGDVKLADKLQGSDAPEAPGMKYRHYAPKAPLYIVENRFEEEVDKWEKKGVKVGTLRDEENLGKYAAEMFERLRRFDEEGVDVILVEKVSDKGLGAAINNRLRKAEDSK